MTVLLKKTQLDYFRKKCKSIPTETMVVLLGRHSKRKNTATIHSFKYPQMEMANKNAVCISEDEVSRIEDIAEELELVVLGTIHSHPPGCLPVCSPTDYQLFTDHKDLLVGICEITITGRTRVVFWTVNSPLPCNLEYIAKS